MMPRSPSASSASSELLPLPCSPKVCAAVILVVALGDRHAPLAFHLAHRAGRVERRPGVANQVGVESRARTHAAGKLAAVAEVHRDRIVGMARRNNHRRLHLAVAHGDLDDVVFFQAQLGQRRAGNDRRVVPAQVGHRLGQLLQPAHVRPAAVVDIRIGPEDDLERILRRRRGNLRR